MATNYKNIGATLAFPNSVFASGAQTLAGSGTDKYFCIHEDDITGLTDSTEGSGFTVTWTGTDPATSTAFASPFTGNAEKIIYGILSKYISVKESLKAKYDTEYEADSTTTQTQGPTGVASDGFSSFQGASDDPSGASRVQNTLNLTFLYNSPTVDVYVD